MADPIANRVTIVPTTNWRGAPARTKPRPIPTRANTAPPSHRRASGFRFRGVRRRPRGSACLLALVAVRIVIGVGTGGFLGFRVVEDDAQHSRFGLLELALDVALGRLVLAARAADVGHPS